jgi:hypothetical protein
MVQGLAAALDKTIVAINALPHYREFAHGLFSVESLV